MSKHRVSSFAHPWNCVLAIVLINVLLLFSNVLGQNHPWMHIDSLKVSFGRVLGKIEEKDVNGNWQMEPTRYIVKIEFPDVYKSEVNTWSRQEWLRNLRTETSDFSTNLILYWITQKDATLLKERMPLGWRKHGKAQDIRYWKRYLKRNRPQIQ